MSDVTHLLSQIQAGDPSAPEQLLPLVYDALRQLAMAKLSQERPGQTLQATALVHEAYLRLIGGNDRQSWDNRGHFFAAAAEAMRRILVEQARHKRSLKAGGGWQRVDLSNVADELGGEAPDMLALNEVLQRLEAKDSRAAQVVKLRFFAGLTIEETALALGISSATVKLDWAYAKSWLKAELLDNPPLSG